MLTASRSAVQTDIVRRTRSTQAARVRTTKRPLWVISGHVQCKSHVRFTPESGHVRCTSHVRFVPIADIRLGYPIT